MSDDDSAGRLVWWPVDSGRVEEIAASARSAVAAVDGSTAHVAYVDPLTDELVYARGPGIWTKETITAGSVVAGGLDIAVGPLGQPSVVYRTSDGVIELGRRTSSGWSAYQVATDSVSPSLDVDADGRHWIVYSAIVQGVPRVTLVDFLDGELGTPLLFSNSRTDMSAIAIDSANAVQLALGFEDAPCDWRDGTTNIVAETPDTPGSPDCYSPGIQVDSGRRAHLAWSSQSTVGVHYARWAGYAGSPWQHFQPVDDSDYAGVTEVSMVLAPDETAHFAFVAGADSETPILVYGAYWR
ncbi:MAG: hypothetical protein H6737_12040 [Alphaproteobacteria bacterium]|nr:hypothetical protein [Alphaproteobacteria bacterium]